MQVTRTHANERSLARWPRVQLKDVAAFASGQRNSETATLGGQYPFFICSDEVLRSSVFDFDTEAVIMSGNNASGIFHLHHYNGRFAARQRTYVITPRTKELNCGYLFRQLAALQPAFQAAAIGTTTLYVTLEMLGRAEVPLPGLDTQLAISEALGDVDALIESLEMLIAKKCQIKQGAMQRLLTGKKRLPGFSGKWDKRRLGNVGEVAGAGVDKKIRPGEMPVRLVNYLDVYRKNFLYSNDLTQIVSAKPEQARRCAIRRGDVFFTPTSELPGDIAHSAIAMEDIPDGVYSYHLVRLRLRVDWDLAFRAYAFKTRAFYDAADSLCEGSGTRYVITLPRFRSMTVAVPPTASEQAAIATVLSDMDAEISALESKLAKARQIKRGMMQELLTGRIRLV